MQKNNKVHMRKIWVMRGRNKEENNYFNDKKNRTKERKDWQMEGEKKEEII